MNKNHIDQRKQQLSKTPNPREYFYIHNSTITDIENTFLDGRRTIIKNMQNKIMNKYNTLIPAVSELTRNNNLYPQLNITHTLSSIAFVGTGEIGGLMYQRYFALSQLFFENSLAQKNNVEIPYPTFTILTNPNNKKMYQEKRKAILSELAAKGFIQNRIEESLQEKFLSNKYQHYSPIELELLISNSIRESDLSYEYDQGYRTIGLGNIYIEPFLPQETNMLILCTGSFQQGKETIESNQSKLSPGCIIIDHGTHAPNDAMHLKQELEAEGLYYYNVPFSGGQQQVIEGQLSLFLPFFGIHKHLCEPLLKCLGSIDNEKVEEEEEERNHLSSTEKKLLNQEAVADSLWTTGRIIAKSIYTLNSLGKKSIDEKFRGFIKGACKNGTGKTGARIRRGEELKEGKFTGGGAKVSIWLKDLNLVVEYNKQKGIAEPEIVAQRDIMNIIANKGYHMIGLHIIMPFIVLINLCKIKNSEEGIKDFESSFLVYRDTKSNGLFGKIYADCKADILKLI